MATNSYELFNTVVQNLLNGGENKINMNGFSGESLSIFSEYSNVFWDGLLEFMQNEKDKDRLNHFGIQDIDLTQITEIDADKIENYKQSIGNFINQKADLLDKFFENCLKDSDRRHHWNESFDQLLGIYWDYFINKGLIDTTYISVDNIINANAGNSFEYQYKIEQIGQEWVKPWKNIDNKTYEEVRSNDKIIRVLNDDSYLQFTHNLFEKYLRLLMPEYERIVEVEDLNRNFWVIGQVLTGICSFLFDEDSPINQLFDGLLDEITQLWENMLYLWVAFALISQLNKYTIVEPIVMPINNDLLRPYIKFDDFGSVDLDVSMINDSDLTDTQKVLKICWDNHLSFLRQKYNESTLIIIPEIRENPYYKNYYAKAYYPGVIIYNRRHKYNPPRIDGQISFWTAKKEDIETLQIEEVIFLPFIQKIGNVDKEGFTIDLSKNNIMLPCNIGGFSIYGVHEETPLYYFKDNFLDNSDTVGLPNVIYFGSIRSIFSDVVILENGNKTSVYEYNYTNYSITNLQFNISFIDIGRDLYDNNGQLHKEYFSCAQESNGIRISAPSTIYRKKDLGDKTSIIIEKGQYLGENPSWFCISNPNFNIEIQKKWSNIPEEGVEENYVSKFKAIGYDSITGDKYSGSVEFELNISESKNAKNSGGVIEQTNTISNLQAYDSAGVLINYTIEESGLENTYWNQSGTNKTINYQSTSLVSNWTNDWTEINYDGKASQINFNVVMVSKDSGYTGALLTPHEAYQIYMSARWTKEIQKTYGNTAYQKAMGEIVDDVTNTIGDTYQFTIERYDGSNKTISYSYLRDYINGAITNSWYEIGAISKPQQVFLDRVHRDYSNTNEGKKEKELWDSAVQFYAENDFKDKDNIAKLYYSHYQFTNLVQKKTINNVDEVTSENYEDYFGLSQVYECSPYLSFITKMNGEIQSYNFDYNVENNTNFDTKIDIPHMTAVEDFGLENSYNYLCAWTGAYVENSSVEAVSVPGFSQSRVDTWTQVTIGDNTTSGARKGNLVYGTSCEKGVTVEFKGNTPYLMNFLLLGQDRACSGIDATKIEEEISVIDNEKARLIYPYYYKCSLTTPVKIGENEHGIITATMYFNKKDSTFSYKWGEPKTRSFYGNNKPDPDIHANAQVAIGRIESTFLSSSNKMTQEVEQE